MRLTPHCYMLSVSVRHQQMVLTVRKFISYESTRFCRMTTAGSEKFLWEGLQGSKLPKKILRTGCLYDLDIRLYRYYRQEQSDTLQGSPVFFFF